MADNTPQTGSATIATDEISGVHYQLVKLAFGPADSATVVTNTAPLPVTDTDGPRATYGATYSVSSTIASDICELIGAVGKVIRVTRCEVSFVSSGTITATTTDVVLSLRASDTGGTTSTAPTIGKYDSSDATPVGTGKTYTGAPTPGTLRTRVGSQKVGVTATAGTTYGTFRWNFGTGGARNPVVRSGESFTVGLSTAVAGTSPALAWSVTIEWTEE
jgi:hypothetical protein